MILPVGPCLCFPIISSAKFDTSFILACHSAEWQAKMNEVSNLAELIIGKQRHGPTGNIMVEFEAMFTKFKDTQSN